MQRRRQLRYELIDSLTGSTLESYPNKTTGLRAACTYIRSYPERTDEVTFLVFERDGRQYGARILLRLTGSELAQVCEDEGIESEDDLGYSEA